LSEPTVIIEEILGRAQQGVTRPFICRGDDDQLYYVKGVGAGRRGQILEWVSAQLATSFGLPVADFVLAEVPVELIEADGVPNIIELGAGVVFASRELPHVQELTVTTRELVSQKLATDVLVFDWWLHNEDRHLTSHGGNPNLLWDMQASQLAVIDHNQAFDRNFNATQFLNSHVFADNWNRVYGDALERQHYVATMQGLLPSLTHIYDSIPFSWWEHAEGVPSDLVWDEVVACLQRCHQEDFWNTP